MKEIRFSNQNMQNYYNEIMNMETSELNLIYCSFRYLRIKRAVSLPYLQIVFYSINCLSSDVIIFCSF